MCDPVSVNQTLSEPLDSTKVLCAEKTDPNPENGSVPVSIGRCSVQDGRGPIY